jgi:hypothetical protein
LIEKKVSRINKDLGMGLKEIWTSEPKQKGRFFRNSLFANP